MLVVLFRKYMKYRFENWCIMELLDLYYANKLNLNPPYQRNDIWPPLSKRRLIESIQMGYPLPTFFLHDKLDGTFDMVDGQQRTRTFMGFQKGFFFDLNKLNYLESNSERLFTNFQISVCIIESNGESNSVEDFYYRVNKYGIKLNRPEMKKAGYADSEFQKMIERISKDQSFTQLALFSEKSLERLNNQDFISELLALIHFGITDKKISVDRLYADQSEVDFELMLSKFNSVIQKLTDLDEIHAISKTRYRQRNDFFTLFNFLLKHFDLPEDLIRYQYKLLVLIDDDIYPTNDKCWPFQEYASNCVSQSNSKAARQDRLKFFEDFLLNRSNINFETTAEGSLIDSNVVSDVLKYYSLSNSNLIQIGDFYLVNIIELNKTKNNKLGDVL